MTQKIYEGPFEFHFAHLSVKDLVEGPFDLADVANAVAIVDGLTMSPIARDVVERCKAVVATGKSYEDLTAEERNNCYLVLSETGRRTMELSDAVRAQAT